MNTKYYCKNCGAEIEVEYGVESYTCPECKKEIAAVNTYELLKYIQKYAWIGGDFGELDYQEAIGLLKACMRNIEDSQYTTGDTLDVLYNIGFEDEQISYLGFDHLFEIEEE